MGYTKDYKPHHIRLTGADKGETTYLFLTWNYGFGHPTITPDGQVKTKYSNLRVSIGHGVPKGSWNATEGDFTEAYRKANRSDVNQITADAEGLRQRIYTYCMKQITDTKVKPSPDMILEAIKGKVVNAVRVRIADYIREYTAKYIPVKRTHAKYLTSASLFDALEELRGMKSFQKFAQVKEAGPIYAGSFCEADWLDMTALLLNASCPITRTIRKHGIKAVTFTDEPEGAYYAANSVEKIQQSLLVVLKRAKKDRVNTTIDLSDLTVTPRRKGRKEELNADEITTVVKARFDNELKENVRRLFVLELFLGGFRVSNMEAVLKKPVIMVKGERMSFPVVYLKQEKGTGEAVVCPAWEPARAILEDGPRPYFIEDQVYNRTLKVIMKDLGLDRLHHKVKRLANGKATEAMVPLHDLISSHSTRRSFKGLMENTMNLKRSLVASMQGHKLNDKSADLAYDVKSPEHACELALRHSATEAEALDFVLLPTTIIKHITKAA